MCIDVPAKKRKEWSRSAPFDPDPISPFPPTYLSRLFHPAPIVRYRRLHRASRIKSGGGYIRVPSKQTGPVFTHKIVFLWFTDDEQRFAGLD